MGVEIEQTLEAQHRYSLASQHRLQSMDVGMRNPMQNRIYIDSPIWLRQQQQSLKNAQLVPKCGVVTPCLNNIHQTVAAVASVTTDIEREMWNIMEASSGAELGEVNYIFPDEKDSVAPTPPPRHKRKSHIKKEDCESPYSYDNCTYTPSPDDNDFEEVFLPNHHQEGGVDHNALNKSLIACAMRDKLRSDIDDRPPSTPNSQSDYEIPKNDDTSSNTPNHKIKTETHTPPLTLKQLQLLTSQENQKPTQISNSNGCLSNNSIFVIDSKSNPISPGHKPKFRKSTQALKAFNSKSFNPSCSCTSDTSVSMSPQRDLKPSIHSTQTSNSSNSSSDKLNTSNHNKLSPIPNHQLPQSFNNNNLNYYTYHYPSSHYQRTHDKFSPLKAMSNLIFPPIVKHSSLFQLFHQNNSEATQISSKSTNKHQTTESKDTNNDVSETGTTLNTELNNTPSVPAMTAVSIRSDS